MIHIVKFSGGKDSLATLLWAEENLPADYRIVFCDTGWEHDLTYEHIQQVSQQIGKPIQVIKSDKYEGMVDLAKKKKRFPSVKARFCTEKLKIEPSIDLVLTLEDDVTIYQGIRAEESEARSKMTRHDEYFKFYFEPYKFKGRYDRQVSKLKKKVTALRNKLEYVASENVDLLLEGPSSSGNLTLQQIEEGNSQLAELEAKLKDYEQRNATEPRVPVFHTYRKKDIVEWTDKYSADLVRPIIEWGGEQVMQYILEKGYKPNPLYYKGMKRVGCFPCIMCSHSEVKAIIEHFPETIEKLKEAEDQVGDVSTFFPKEYIPAKHCTKETPKGNVPVIEDVVRYLTRNNDPNQVEMFQRPACMSFYNICE